jgi:hypothetical protein
MKIWLLKSKFGKLLLDHSWLLWHVTGKSLCRSKSVSLAISSWLYIYKLSRWERYINSLASYWVNKILVILLYRKTCDLKCSFPFFWPWLNSPIFREASHNHPIQNYIPGIGSDSDTLHLTFFPALFFMMVLITMRHDFFFWIFP